MIVLDLPDETATAELAARISALAEPGDVIALKGDLGAGKTSFARAFIRARGDRDEEVPSPTFTLVQVYECVPDRHLAFRSLSAAFPRGGLGARDRGSVRHRHFADRMARAARTDLLPARRLEIALAFGDRPERAAGLARSGQRWRRG